MHTSVRATSDPSACLAADRLADRSTDDAAAHGSQEGDAGAGAATTEIGAPVLEIVERATTLRERLMPGSPVTARGDAEQAGASIDAWCNAAAKGDAAAFARRLERDGLDLAGAHRALATVRAAPGAPLPEWALLLERYVRALGRQTTLTNCDETIPFAELLTPLADIAEQGLRASVPHALEGVSSKAHHALRNSLLRRLASLAAPILYERFQLRRADGTAKSWPHLDRGVPRSSSPRALYANFVRCMRASGMLRLLQDLPVLARAMSTTAILWRDASAELLLRLRADRVAIAHRFASGRELGDLVRLDAGRSDPHAGGRTVHLLSFASGLRLLYKPRSLGADHAFMALLDWLAVRGAPVPPPGSPTFAARVLDRESYGWAEYIEDSACADQAAVRRYYQNAGALLALLHTLGSTDCHHENVVASGDRPVIVDLETVLQPEIARADPPVDRARNLGARRLYDDSVLRTGILPIWQRADDHGAYDIGGLSASGNETTSFSAIDWTAINTDAMRLEHRRATTVPQRNLPRVADGAVSPAGYVRHIELGFERMYDWLAAHRVEIIAPGGPLERLAREEIRFIARPSSVYDYVLRRSLRGAVLHDGAARGVELELLARGLVQLPSELWPLLDEEQRALEQLDIPAFTIPGNATVLSLGERSIAAARSGLDVARTRFESLGRADLELQLRIVRGSFALRYGAAPGAGADDLEHREWALLHDSETRAPRHYLADAGSGTTPLLPRRELLAEAKEIASEIAGMALDDANGDPAWITAEPISVVGHRRLQATGYGLYDGLAGIALFLAAVARCTGDTASAQLARRALAPIRSRLGCSSSYVDEYGLGGAGGAAAIVYSLTRTGLLLDDDTVIDDAVRAASQITSAVIARDTSYDVLYGSAGAILALLVLHRLRDHVWLLQTAAHCARRLMDSGPAFATSRRTIQHPAQNADGQAQVGFAHGCSGMALALCRLGIATGVAEYAAAGLDALRQEDHRSGTCGGASPVDAASGLDVTSLPGAASRPTNWCRGAAGVGLARLACSPGSDTAALRAGAEREVAHVLGDRASGAYDLDGACCGRMGEVELLLTAGLRWGRQSLLTAAQERASRVVRRARSVGHYRTCAPGGVDVSDPTLYRGLAGIGYGLLRLCHPELLPSFLSWE